MQQESVVHSTFVLERSYPATPERVFAAFADPDLKRRWFVEGGGNTVHQYLLDFRPGGKEIGVFSHAGPMEGILFTNETTFLDIVANRRIVFASTMSMADSRISASLGTVEFLPADTGTDLIFTHQGAFFEGADGPGMREGGWRKLLERLTAAIEN